MSSKKNKNFDNTESWKKDVGLRFVLIRTELKMNQKKFSYKLGISPSFLSYVERGKRSPSFFLVYSLQSIFQVNLNWLLTGTGNMFVKPAISTESKMKLELDKKLFLEVYERLETIFQEKNIILDPKKKGELIFLLYESILDDESSKSKELEKIPKLLKIIS